MCFTDSDTSCGLLNFYRIGRGVICEIILYEGKTWHRTSFELILMNDEYIKQVASVLVMVALYYT